MKDYTPWLKLLGGIWLCIGIVGLVWGALGLFAVPLNVLLPFSPASTTRAFWDAFRIRPWTEVTIITIGVLLIIMGRGMIQRQSWTQTLMVPVHLLFTVYAATGWVMAYALQNDPQTQWSLGPVLFLTLTLLNGGIALLMSSVGATEALSWLPLQTAPLTPLRCEFCGAELDAQTGRCPKCEMVADQIPRRVVQELLRAKLVNLDDNTEFWVEPTKKTFIGRGLMHNDLNVNNPTISRRHAQIEYQEGHFVITALQDSNGTFVNEERVRQQTLNNGDKVRLGRARFQFVIDQT